MKKTFSINISGTIFHIDEDAYEKLQNYLQKLNQHFGGNEEGREILQDIEARIAELFNEKIKDSRDVIIEPWVDEIITRMGTPEDFMEEEETAEKINEVYSARSTKRRMYRDPDHRVLGGVCGGIGVYFNIDPVIMRVLFFVLFFLIGPFNFLLYIMLWIAVPKAVTTAQRLEMRGEDATVSNIEKSIKEEVKDVNDSYQRFKNSDSYERGREGMSRLGELVYTTFKVVLKVVVVIVGIVLTFIGFTGLLSFVSALLIGHSILAGLPFMLGWSPDLHVTGLFVHFISPGALLIVTIAVILLVAIPLLMTLLIGTKMIFRYKTNNKAIGLSSVGVWLVALFVLIIVAVGQVGNFNKKTSISSSRDVNCQNCQTLVINLGDNLYQDYTDSEFDLDRMRIVKVDGKQMLLGEPRLDIEKSNSSEYSVVVKKKARGKNLSEAKKNIETIVYNFQQRDSVLTFDPYYTLGNKANWRDQEVDITLKVPVGRSVYLDDDLVPIIYDIENVSNTWDGDMVGKSWIMTENGLALNQ